MEIRSLPLLDACANDVHTYDNEIVIPKYIRKIQHYFVANDQEVSSFVIHLLPLVEEWAFYSGKKLSWPKPVQENVIS